MAAAQTNSATALWRSGLSGNARRVAAALRGRGPSTRAELATATRLSRPTVSATLAELTAAGLVLDWVGTASPPSRGRPAGLVRLAQAAGLAIGVDVGRRHVAVAVADLGHEVLVEHAARIKEDADEHPDQVLDRAIGMVDAALAEVGAARCNVVGVGLGIPAPITRAGTIGSPTLLPAWASVTPGELLADRLGLPVLVDNDANLCALGEYQWGAATGCPVVVYVKVATGVGAGIVLDGRLFRGSIGTAGEVGHITLDARGPVCRCGNRGCVELSVGGQALLRHARTTHPWLTDLPDLVKLAVSGDPGCRRLLADAGTQLGLALGGLVNLLNPDRIVVGGELGAATDLMLEPVRRGLADTAMPAAVAAVRVVPAELGDRAAALGGVASVLTAATEPA